MKKYIFWVMTCLILINSAYGKVQFGFAIFLNPGYAMNQDYNNAVDGVSEYWVHAEYNNSIFIPEIELDLKLQPDIAIGFGFSSVSLPLGATKIECVTNPSQDFINVQMDGNVYIMSLSEYYILPLGGKISLNLGAGGDYYIAKVNYKLQSNMNDNFVKNINGEFTSNGIGFNAKMLLEFKIRKRFRLMTGVIGRIMRIGNLKGTVSTYNFNTNTSEEREMTLYSLNLGVFNPMNPWEELQTFRVWYPYTPKAEAETNHYYGDNDEDVKPAVINLTGIQFCFGIGVYF